jgi:hypothetical protein
VQASWGPVEAKRRWLVIGALTVAVAGVAIGSFLAFAGSGSGLADASYPGYHLSFRYPAAWKRKDWCWIGTSVFPLTLLTKAPAAPTCQQNAQFGSGTPLPPPQRLAPDGVSAWWFASDATHPALGRTNATVDGRPAHITVQRQSTRRTSKSYVNCRSGRTQRFLTAQIQGPTSNVAQIELGAVVCGPDFAVGLADVRKMLDSVRITS